MRVIGGELRGRRLRAPSGAATRPTSDRVREALFDIIAARVEGVLFLDAYAGTGAVGIESLSRGAAHCTFVESERNAARVLTGNLEALDLSSRARVLTAPFALAAAELAREGRAFDVVFLDPPYGHGELLRGLRLTASLPLLRPGGVVIAEHGGKLETPAREGVLGLKRTARYGDTRLSFFERG